MEWNAKRVAESRDLRFVHIDERSHEPDFVPVAQLHGLVQRLSEFRPAVGIDRVVTVCEP